MSRLDEIRERATEGTDAAINSELGHDALALLAVIDALPRCGMGCGAVATRALEGYEERCESHALDVMPDLPYAPALRALLKGSK